MRIVKFLLLACLGFSAATPAAAVKAFWIQPEIPVEADEPIVPGLPTGATSDDFEPNDRQSDAKPLRVNTEPQDHVLTPGDQDWFLLFAGDGPGYIRIGVDGPLTIKAAPGDDFSNAGLSEFDGPTESELVETSEWSVTEQALNWGVESAIMQITSSSTKPVRYRISFVSELPENRVGSAYGPGVAAEAFVTALGEGDLTTLYRMSRTHFTTEQADALRQSTFGSKTAIKDGWGLHMKDPNADVDALGYLPRQQVILSAVEEPGDMRQWAFRVDCVQRDGLWLVDSVERDPSLSESDVAAIVDRDMSSALENEGSGATDALVSRSWLPVSAVVLVLATVALILHRRRSR